MRRLGVVGLVIALGALLSFQISGFRFHVTAPVPRRTSARDAPRLPLPELVDARTAQLLVRTPRPAAQRQAAGGAKRIVHCTWQWAPGTIGGKAARLLSIRCTGPRQSATATASPTATLPAPTSTPTATMPPPTPVPTIDERTTYVADETLDGGETGTVQVTQCGLPAGSAATYSLDPVPIVADAGVATGYAGRTVLTITVPPDFAVAVHPEEIQNWTLSDGSVVGVTIHERLGRTSRGTLELLSEKEDVTVGQAASC